jgi:hypothetical protein
MANIKARISKAQSYPYTILPIQCPPPEIANKLDRLQVLEFFRIEALLRSSKVHAWYGKCYIERDDDSDSEDFLFTHHQVMGGWKVLDGAHHYLLKEPRAKPAVWELGAGIIDIAAYYYSRSRNYELLIKHLTEEPRFDRYLWLRLDTAYPPSAILRQLETHVRRLHETARHKDEDTGRLDIPSFFKFRPRDKSGMYGHKGISTWLQYLKCYDLRITMGLTYGQVAAHVYGRSGRSVYARAKKAVDRIRKVIHAAEKQYWPPSIS